MKKEESEEQQEEVEDQESFKLETESGFSKLRNELLNLKSTGASKLTNNVSFMGKSLPLWAVLLIATGSATAVTAAIVFGSITGTGTVDEGLQFNPKAVSGNGQVTEDGGFTFEVNQGGEFSFEFAKENLANDKTQPLVESVVIDGNNTGLSHKTLEKVSFYAKQTTLESEGSTVPKGRTVDLSMSWDSKGEVTDNGADYLDVTSKDVDSDGNKEIIVGIGDEDGMIFGPNEHWNAEYTINTQTNFPETNLTVDAKLASKYNPEKGKLSDVAKIMPQY